MYIYIYPHPIYIPTQFISPPSLYPHPVYIPIQSSPPPPPHPTPPPPRRAGGAPSQPETLCEGPALTITKYLLPSTWCKVLRALVIPNTLSQTLVPNSLVQSIWYHVLAWYQVLGTEYFATSTLYQVLCTKDLVIGTEYFVPST